MNISPANSLRRNAAFTLTEVIIASTLVTITMAMVVPFLIVNLRLLFVSEQKLLINGDVRKLTNDFIENARESNYFILYNGFYSRSLPGGVTAARDFDGSGAVDIGDRMTTGRGGEFLVMVYTEFSTVVDSRYYNTNLSDDPVSSRRVKRIVGYWLAPNRTNTAEVALYKFDSDLAKTSPSATTWTTPWGATFPADLATSTVESLLPPATSSAATAGSASILVNDIVGTASNFIFVNSSNQSVQIHARILHGNQAKRVTDTYNFGISPRG